MRSSATFRLFVALSLLLGIDDGSLAQERASVSVHRTCIGGGTGEKLFLRYWWPDVNNSIPEPVCVFKTSEFGDLPFRSARITPDRTGIGAIVVVEFDETARPLIEKMSQDNVGKLMAVVVGDRIASMPMISRPYSDNKLLISVSSEREATRIVAALSPPPREGKK
jgi:hypothetical protein